mmetsp:Transcript_2580/g.9869  ORF Transcript_2580/g.9869 Transcript_2580/m.9869 type:complete len:850 (-) Transcript_2580:1937-4486(-)
MRQSHHSSTTLAATAASSSSTETPRHSSTSSLPPPDQHFNPHTKQSIAGLSLRSSVSGDSNAGGEGSATSNADDDDSVILDIITNSPSKRRHADSVPHQRQNAVEATNIQIHHTNAKEEQESSTNGHQTLAHHQCMTSHAYSPQATPSSAHLPPSKYAISVPMYFSKTNQTEMLHLGLLTRLNVWQMHEFGGPNAHHGQFASEERNQYQNAEEVSPLDLMDTGDTDDSQRQPATQRRLICNSAMEEEGEALVGTSCTHMSSPLSSPPTTDVTIHPTNPYRLNSRIAIIAPLSFVPIQDYKQRESNCDALMVYEIKNENVLVEMAVKNGAALRVRVSERLNGTEEGNQPEEDCFKTSTLPKTKQFPNSSTCQCLRMKKVVQELETNPFGRAVDGIIVDAKYVDASKCVFLPPPRKKRKSSERRKRRQSGGSSPTNSNHSPTTSPSSSSTGGFVRQITSYFTSKTSTSSNGSESTTYHSASSTTTTTTTTTTSSPHSPTTTSPTSSPTPTPAPIKSSSAVLVFSPTYISTRIKQHNLITEDDILRIISGFARGEILTREDAKFIIEEMLTLFSNTPNVLELDIDERGLIVVGDLHGNLQDMLYIFQERGLPCNAQPYVFLGDFVDRGDNCPEVILLAFALKLCFPSSVYILRGNHESESVNQLFEKYNQGWISEFVAKYDQRLFERIEETFNHMPLMCIANQKIAFVHGGIGAVNSLQAIRKLNRISDVQTGGVLSALLWSDPVEQPCGFSKSSRGTGIFNYGPDVTEGFFRRNQLEYLIRSHTVVEDGLRLNHSNRVVTIFSCSQYNSNPNQRGAILMIDKNLDMQVWRFHSRYNISEVIALNKDEKMNG